VQELLDFVKANPTILSGVAGAAVTALAIYLIPYLWRKGSGALAWLLGKFSGRYEHREFEKRYLDWVVTSLQHLKLAGIVPSDDAAKRPRLEQVFISLHVVEQPPQGEAGDDIDFLRERILAIQTVAHERADLPERLRVYLASLDEVERKELRQTLIQRPSAETADLVRDVVAASLSRTPGPPEPKDDPDQLKRILQEHSRIVILGVPGCGKTSLLQFVALAFARDRPGDTKLRQRRRWRSQLGYSGWRTPLFVPLSAAAPLVFQDGGKLSFLEIVMRTLSPELQGHKGSATYFMEQLDKGKCVVLLDGLDEVAKDDEFQATARALQGFITRYGSNQFIVTSRDTSRVAGWRDGAGSDFRAFYVDDLTASQIDKFIGLWCEAVERSAVSGPLQDESEADRRMRQRRTEERAAALRAALRDNPSIRSLAKNPMLLSIVALVQRSPRQALRSDRVTLYAQCTALLLEQWDVQKGLRVDDTRLTLQQKETVMRRLAIMLHVGDIGEQGGGRQASRSEVEKVIASVLQDLRPINNEEAAVAEASVLLNLLIERSGLLVERQRGVLTFAHHTFQEYFSALFLARDEPEKNRDFLLAPERLLADWWREVVLLYVGAIADASDFLERVADPARDDLCQQRLRLAAACLGEKPTIRRRDVRQDLTNRLLYVRTRSCRTAEADRYLDQLTGYLVIWSRDPDWYHYAAFRQVHAQLDRGEEPELVPEILAGLDDRRAVFREAALYAVVSLPYDPKYQAVREKATELLADPDVNVRRIARPSVARFGADAAVPALAEGVRDDKDARSSSLEALEQIADRLHDPEAAARRLEFVLQDNEIGLYERSKIADAYGAVMDDAQIALFVKGALDAPNAPIFLSDLLKGGKADIVREALFEALESASGQSLRSAITLLANAAAELPTPSIIVERVIQHFSDPDETMRKFASDTLRDLAESGLRSLVLDRITPLLKETEPMRRSAALRCLQAIPPADVTPMLAQDVLHACGDANAEVRRAASEALRVVEVDTLEQEKMAALVRLAQNPDTGVRVAAIEAIAAAENSDASLTVVLLKALGDESEIVRTATATALTKLGRKVATPKVIDRLLKSLVPPALPARSWKTLKMAFAAARIPSKEDSSVSKRYEGSYEAAAAEAISTLADSDEQDQIAKRLTAVVAKKSNGPARWYALQKLAPLAAADTATFERLVRMAEQDPDLIGPWCQREEANAVIGSLIGSMRQWHSAYVLRHGDHPLLVLWKRLPSAARSHQVDQMLKKQLPRLRVLGLQLIAKGNGALKAEEVAIWIGQASMDAEKSVRGEALRTAEILLKVGARPKLLTAVANCLQDDDSDVRESAWRIMQPHLVE
jgi:hypothetical protein